MKRDNDITILYEDNHLLVISKPSGMLSQGDSSGELTIIDHCKDYLKTKYNKPGKVFLAPAHRLDKPVSGTLILARTSKAASRLHGIFSQRKVKKYYLMLTEGIVESAQWVTCRDNIIRKENRSLVLSHETEESQEAVLKYRYLTSVGGSSLILVELLTGRKHQIRSQMAHRGLPVLGDRLYGDKRYSGSSIALHSYLLAFDHPVKREPLTCISPLPETSLWQPVDLSTNDLKKLFDDTVAHG